MSMAIEEVVISPRSPWQSPYDERLISSIRRDSLDHVIVFNERHLLRLLKSYLDGYHHPARCHQGLDGNSPHPRQVETPSMGKVVVVPKIGGLQKLQTLCY